MTSYVTIAHLWSVKGCKWAQHSNLRLKVWNASLCGRSINKPYSVWTIGPFCSGSNSSMRRSEKRSGVMGWKWLYCMRCTTCKYRGLNKLNQLIYFRQKVDSNFKVTTTKKIQYGLEYIFKQGLIELTSVELNLKPEYNFELRGITPQLPPDCDTSICTAFQRGHSFPFNRDIK